MKIGGYIEITVRLFEEEGQWTAECVELGTATCADSFEDAQAAITDMVRLHLNALEDAGVCEDFLNKHGVKFHKGMLDQKPRRKSNVKVRPGEFAGRTRIPFQKPQSHHRPEAIAL